MRADQAKRIHMKDVLAALDYQPAQERNGELWYVSPFRQEKDASFKLSRDGRAWFDHGMGQGGNILDFVMQYDQTDLRGALQRIEELALQPRLPMGDGPAPMQDSFWNSAQTLSEAQPALGADPEKVEHSREDEDGFSVTKIQPLQHRALCHYLKQRGIDAKVARPYVQEMHYVRDGNAYFGLAFVNDSGGYELRNPYFKGTTGTKDITIITPTGEGETSAIAIFEGFTDFLSAMMLAGHPPTMGCIVLNSVAMQDRAVQAIQQMGAERLYLYLDRDQAGQALAQHFRKQLPELAIHDASGLYAGHKDINEYLVAKRKSGVRER